MKTKLVCWENTHCSLCSLPEVVDIEPRLFELFENVTGFDFLDTVYNQ